MALAEVRKPGDGGEAATAARQARTVVGKAHGVSAVARYHHHRENREAENLRGLWVRGQGRTSLHAHALRASALDTSSESRMTRAMSPRSVMLS